MKIYTNQKTQFENGETFRRLSRDSEAKFYQNFLSSPIFCEIGENVSEKYFKMIASVQIRYASFLDRPIQERQKRLLEAAREGRAEVVFVNTGIHIREWVLI